MKFFDKIQGKTTSGLLRQLQNDSTLIKMNLLDNDYESLTMVTDIRTQGKIPFFLIDYPDGFREAVTEINDWKIQFEFTGRDNIQYWFMTSGGEFNRDEIMVRFPKLIERRQKRKHFRIKTPAGTRLKVELNSTKHEMSVIDISIGGAFSALASTRKQPNKRPPFKTGQKLKNAILFFPSKREGQCILINKMLTKRVALESSVALYRYAFQFIEMENEYEKALTEIIYDIQRKHLRARLPME